MNAATITRLANNIAMNQSAYPEEAAVARIATHINAFWTPAMRRKLVTLSQQPDNLLHPSYQQAIAAVSSGS